jgi:hypothetical protein
MDRFSYMDDDELLDMIEIDSSDGQRSDDCGAHVQTRATLELRESVGNVIAIDRSNSIFREKAVRESQTA